MRHRSWLRLSAATAAATLTVSALAAPARAEDIGLGPYVDAPGFRSSAGTDNTYRGPATTRFTITDPDLAKIELSVRGRVVGADTAAPWVITWDTSPYQGRTS